MKYMPRIDVKRLMNRLEELGQIGLDTDGGTSRLALSDEDKQARDLVISWMKKVSHEIRIDGIGNIIATRKGKYDLPAVMMGSHIDTVKSGGKYDGNLGVLTGIEILETLNEHNILTDRPLSVAVFTNEEGSRFAPDMMGSMVYTDQLSLDKALSTVGICGTTVKENLEKIGYNGKRKEIKNPPHSFFELHIEQGPILDREKRTIGVVEAVQGISWMEITLEGESCHAGTYPMSFRKDVSYLSSLITIFTKEITDQIGINQVATVGSKNYYPNLINVVPSKVTMTVDMRNPNELELHKAELMLQNYVKKICNEANVEFKIKKLARFLPTNFDTELVDMIEAKAENKGYSTRRLYSPAGHDAQVLANICPSAMIFIPCKDGISHNPLESVKEADIEAGSKILFDCIVESASVNRYELIESKTLSA